MKLPLIIMFSLIFGIGVGFASGLAIEGCQMHRNQAKITACTQSGGQIDCPELSGFKCRCNVKK